MAARKFPREVAAAIDQCKMLGIKAGSRPHRFIHIWSVLVEGRVFARSWSLKPRSWYRTFLDDPEGVLQLGGKRIAIRAVRTRSDRLKDAVSRAYLAKYSSPGSIKFAKDMGRARSRDATLELVPR